MNYFSILPIISITHPHLTPTPPHLLDATVAVSFVVLAGGGLIFGNWKNEGGGGRGVVKVPG